jgi:4a-hydroxytetrahydrobiopterin dehydratase
MHQVYNRVFIRWTTHSPPGLGSQDVQMAQFCDDQAKALGEIPSLGGKELSALVEPLISVNAEA